VIGIIDILVAFSVLLKPQKFVLVYATIWAFMTALARITAGDPVWDFAERAANWAVPLALLLYIQLKSKIRENEKAHARIAEPSEHPESSKEMQSPHES